MLTFCEPIKETSNSKKRYLLTFIYDFSQKTWVYFLTKKIKGFYSFQKLQVTCWESEKYFTQRVVHKSWWKVYISRIQQFLPCTWSTKIIDNCIFTVTKWCCTIEESNNHGFGLQHAIWKESAYNFMAKSSKLGFARVIPQSNASGQNTQRSLNWNQVIGLTFQSF